MGMKKSVMAGCAMLLCVAMVSSPAYAGTAGEKLMRGGGNILTGWMEIPLQVQAETKETNPVMGITFGLGRGIGMAVARTLVGAYEVVTFPIPVPSAYEPMIEPANVLSK